MAVTDTTVASAVNMCVSSKYMRVVLAPTEGVVCTDVNNGSALTDEDMLPFAVCLSCLESWFGSVDFGGVGRVLLARALSWPWPALQFISTAWPAWPRDGWVEALDSSASRPDARAKRELSTIAAAVSALCSARSAARRSCAANGGAVASAVGGVGAAVRRRRKVLDMVAVHAQDGTLESNSCQA